jgi:hypothetical protein
MPISTTTTSTSTERIAFWVAPNMEFFEYLPENRPTQPATFVVNRAHIGKELITCG